MNVQFVCSQSGWSRNRLVVDFLLSQGGPQKRAFSFFDFSYKNSTSYAKNCTARLKIATHPVYYAIEYLAKWQLLNFPCCQHIVDTIWNAPHVTNLGRVYKILNSVVGSIATHRKITVPIVWYIMNTSYKFQLMKRPTGCAVSLARRGTYSSWCHYFFFWRTRPFFDVHKLTVQFKVQMLVRECRSTTCVHSYVVAHRVAPFVGTITVLTCKGYS